MTRRRGIRADAIMKNPLRGSSRVSDAQIYFSFHARHTRILLKNSRAQNKSKFENLQI